MSFTTAEGKALLTPAQIEDLLVRPVLQTSIPGRVCTTIRTRSQVLEIPKMSSKVTAAWTSQLEEIPVSTPGYDTMSVIPAKVSSLVPYSSEMAEDAREMISNLLGEQMVDATTTGLNSAFLTSQPSPAPAGLAAITPTVINAGASAFASFDAFVGAASSAIDRRTPITSWIMSPATRTKLLTIITAGGPVSSGPYLDDQRARANEVRMIEGGEIIASSDVPDDVVWGIPRTRALLVLRRDVRIETSDHALWTRDGRSIRSTMRAAFAFPDESAIVKITTDAP